MSLLVRFAPTSETTTAQYDDAIRRLEEAGDFPPEGLEYHVCFLVDGDVRVSESGIRGSSSMPSRSASCRILNDVGIDPGDPDILEIHNTIRR